MHDRYRLPDPKCNHAPKGRVSAGEPDGAYASTYVCDRPACIEDAKEWAEAQVRQPAHHTPMRVRQAKPEPTVFGAQP